MANQQLHLRATAGWRALLTQAQHAAGQQLSGQVEEHLVSLLFRYIGADMTTAELDNGLLDRFERLTNADTSKPSVVGDQCLMYAGLIPEHVISRGMSVAYFVQLGRTSYADPGLRNENGIYSELAREFVAAMDILQTLRVMHSGQPCIDGFNAFCLWHDLGSRHAWRVLRSLSGALPVSGPVSELVH